MKNTKEFQEDPKINENDYLVQKQGIRDLSSNKKPINIKKEIKEDRDQNLKNTNNPLNLKR